MQATQHALAQKRDTALIIECLSRCRQSNPTFYLRDSRKREYVLRKRPPGKLLPSAHMVEREYRVMKALRGSFPVPEMLCLCEDQTVIGQAFCAPPRSLSHLLHAPTHSLMPRNLISS